MEGESMVRKGKLVEMPIFKPFFFKFRQKNNNKKGGSSSLVLKQKKFGFS